MAKNNQAQSAQRFFRIALAYKDKYAGGANRETSLVCLAQANAIMGDDTEAVQLAEAERVLASRTEVEGARLLLSLAQIDRDLRRPDAGIAKLNKALPVLESAGSLEDFIYALICASYLHHVQGDLASAQSYAERALAVLESQRQHTSPVYRHFMRRTNDIALDALLQSLHRPNQLGSEHAARALSELEHGRWRSLIEGLGEQALSPPADFPPELKSKEAELLQAWPPKNNMHWIPPSLMNTILSSLMVFEEAQRRRDWL